MRNACRVIVGVAALLAAVGGVVRGQTGSGLLNCGIPPTDAQCQVRLGAKDTAVVVIVKPTTLNGGQPQLTVASNRCCLDSVRVTPDANGLVRLRWSSATPPDSTVRLYVYLPSPPGTQLRGEIALLPPAPPPPVVKQAIGIAPQSLDVRYVWVRGYYVPSVVQIDVDHIGGVQAQPDKCEAVQYVLTPRLKGEATPDSGSARWFPAQNGVGGTCRIETRWKLGAAATQQMDVRLLGENLQTTRATLHGFGRIDPRVMGGLGWFRNIVRDIDIQCDSATQRSECASASEFPKKVTVTRRQDGLEAYGAVEFPLIFRTSYQSSAAGFVLRRIRLMGGTTLRHPERNFFAGINVMPLVNPFMESVPFQITVGSTLNGRKRLFYGVSVDAEIIKTPLVGIFGLN